MAYKEIKFLVIPQKDLDELFPSEKKQIHDILKHIDRIREATGREELKENKYIVCNEDEPYASKIWDIILAEEE